MKIIVNTKDKLDEKNLKKYILENKNNPITICVPLEFAESFQNDNVFVQSFDSIEFLKVNNIKGSLVGHSIYNETNDIINNKIKLLSENNLSAVVCVGEKVKGINSKDILKESLAEILTGINCFKNVSIAYEPIWAIGGDKKVDINYIINNGKYIKEILNDITKDEILLLYGGSVDINLINDLKDYNIFDGFLISSYALEVNNIKKILKNDK